MSRQEPFWTPAEEARLLKLKADGLSLPDLCERLGRSREAIKTKLKALRSAAE